MNRYEYKIHSIKADGNSDEDVVSSAEKVINDHASSGWRLHTYSYVAADPGGFSHVFKGQTTLKNLLHLVFEREKPLRGPEKDAAIAEDDMEKGKADALKSLDDMEKRKADALKSLEKFRNEKKERSELGQK